MIEIAIEMFKLVIKCNLDKNIEQFLQSLDLWYLKILKNASTHQCLVQFLWISK